VIFGAERLVHSAYMPYLIDSDVLIDISRGKEAAREYIDGLTEGWAVSQISALELIVGARDNRDLASIDTFLSAYVIVPLRDSTGKRAYELVKLYAKRHGLHVFDSLVAATAIEEGFTLVTRNRRHFDFIEGLSLEVPVY
jgi:predicted nucleic acid-binding protein